jgi:hypothetical protein
MVVLARAVGLPTRLVVGYFTGTPERSEDAIRYTVTEADAHAWPEVYFPEIGWVEFEPTAGRPGIERLIGALPVVEAEPSSLTIPGEAAALRLRNSALRFMAAIGAVLLIASVSWLAYDTWLLRRLPDREAAAELYLRLFHSLDRLGVLESAGQTPYELLTSLDERLSVTDRVSAPLRPTVDEARYIVQAVVESAFGPHRPQRIERRQLLRAWRRLGPRLWLARGLSALS